VTTAPLIGGEQHDVGVLGLNQPFLIASSPPPRRALLNPAASSFPPSVDFHDTVLATTSVSDPSGEE
jgi:hypothetical protein